MRISTLVLLISLVFCASSLAQTRLGIKAGINTVDVGEEIVRIYGPNGNERLQLSVKDANIGINIGVYLLAKSKHLFIQPEVVYNSNTIDFLVDTFNGTGFGDRTFEEKYQNLDIPILMGFRFGFLRIGAGPVGHVFLNSTSELVDIPGYEPIHNNFTLGYQAGIGIDFWAINLDIRYEGNLTKFGDHMNFFGEEVTFADNPVRFIGTIGISF